MRASSNGLDAEAEPWQQTFNAIAKTPDFKIEITIQILF